VFLEKASVASISFPAKPNNLTAFTGNPVPPSTCLADPQTMFVIWNQSSTELIVLFF
jgi:hypothetical protein